MSLSPTVQLVVSALGVLSSLALAVGVLARPPRRLTHWSFAAGMLGLAAEALVAGGLLVASESAETHGQWASALQVLGLLLPWPWALFAFALGRASEAPVPWGWKLVFFVEAVVLASGAALTLLWPPFRFFPDAATFTGAPLTVSGQVGVMLQALGTVAVLYGLEPSLRRSHSDTRWRVKYLALGLGGVFAVRFYLLSQVLLFQVLLADFVLVTLAALAIGNVLVAASLVRTSMLGVDLAVSRHFVYRSVAVVVAGGYLLVAGVASWLLRELGVPETALWGSAALFVSAVGVAGLLLSENLRWRVKRYISTNFYRSKYDYREQWRTFTTRLTSRVTMESLVPELVRSVSEAVGSARVLLYLHDDHQGRLQLAGSVGETVLPAVLSVESADLLTASGGRPAWLFDAWTALQRSRGKSTPDGPVLAGAEIAALVALPWQGRLLGLLLIGAERTGEPYGPEDLELLATIGEQAAAVVAGAQVSERLAQARSFEAFHRLTSFVVHDLKNAVSALSMLSRNALEYFDDPEFQRDAVKTLSRTVDRMKRLLDRLAATPSVTALTLEEVDIARLTVEVADSLLASRRVKVVRRIDPIPTILGDAGALERVLQTLITNALEAMDGEGALTFRTERRDDRVACAVGDTGCGMSAEFVRSSLFVPFQSTKKGGWGIGLYQAKEIVEAHGGCIEVETEEGRGTTFTLLFPPAAGRVDGEVDPR